ncbi:MAG: GNAT family N-acetyltransferase [Tenericutes bacterium]|jgi:ribosomal protein S18 acetylase RimI-like enzyme|nr:GNAT family N-acetyltransferase [Mycoplasmatota bacterium]
MNDLIIRKAVVNDAEGKGYVHYKSWIETYTGLFPTDVMEKITLERSVKLAKEHPENTYVAIIDEKIVGFACYIKARDEDYKNAGEIMAVYILNEYKHMDIGKALMKVCYKELSNYKSIILWVLEINDNAIGFY